MSRQGSNRSRWAVPLLLGGGVLAVIGYNTWAYCCGYCTIETFTRLGIPGWSLLGATAVAALAWTVLRVRNNQRQRKLTCACGRSQVLDWNFCPDCGAASTATWKKG